jgi:hypothetical protein
MLKAKPKRQYKERLEQVKFVVWLKKMGYRVSGSGVGVNLSMVQAVALKSMGVAKGYPDIFVPLPKHPYHGFFIEMKSDTGRLSIEQVEWLAYLRESRYYAEVAFSFEQAKAHFLSYLGTPLDTA